jgi:phospholipid/cholesterol/gamma-HCH transport system substrate-binding protein
MESRAHALAAGVFVILFGLAVAYGAWWLSGKREATAEYLLVSSRSIVGLNPQAQVRYRGVRAGKVQEIGIDPQDRRNIVVRITLGGRFPVTRSTTAQLNYQGVTGLAYVQLDDDGSSSEPLTAADGELARIPLKATGMESLTESAAQVLAQVKELAARINTLASPENIGRLSATLANLESASAGLDRTMKLTPEVVAGVKQVVSPANIERLNRIVANLEQTSGQAAPLVGELRQLAQSMQGAARRIEELSGTAGAELAGGTLPRVNDLMRDLSGVSRQLSALLRDLDRAPQSLIFGRGPVQPGPGEPGFASTP